MRKQFVRLAAACAAGLLVVSAQGAVVLQNADWATETFRTNGMGAAHYKLPANVTNFTVEAWVNPSHTYPSGTYNYIFSVMEGGGSAHNMLACLARGMFTLYLGGSWYPAYGTESAAALAIPLNEWTHVAVSKTKDSARLFVNGEFKWEATGLSLTNALSTGYVAGIGSERTGHNNTSSLNDTNNRVFQGKLADVRLWTEARTDEEIAAGYATRLTGTEENLFLYVPFSDGTAGGSVVKNWAEGLDLVVPPTQQLVEDALLDAKLAGAAVPPPASIVALHSSRIAKAAVRTDVKLTTTTYTLETWAMLDQALTGTARAYLMGQYVGGNRTTWVSLVVEGAAMTPKFYIGSDNPVIADTNVETGKWFHLAVTRDADGTVKLYLNGKLVGSGTRSVGAPPDDVLELFNTGSLPNNNASIFGFLREARAWNRARTAEEIASGYARAASGKEEGLLGCWPLDDGTGKMVRNKATGGYGTMTRSTAGSYNTGLTWQPAYALRSERAGKGITTDVKITTSDFTIETWARIAATPSAKTYLAGQYVGKNTTTWVSLVFEANSRKPAFHVGSATGGVIIRSSELLVNLNEWFHLAATRSGTDVTLYLNGHVVGTGTALTTDPPPDNPFQLFNTGSNTAFGGDLREVRVWDHARTQEQIVAAINDAATGHEEGLVGCWPLTEGRSATRVLNRVTRETHALGTGNAWVADSSVPALAPLEEAVSAELAPVLDGAWFSVMRTTENMDLRDFTFETWVRPMAWLDADRWTPLFNQWRHGSSLPNRFVMGFNDTDHFGVFISGNDAEGNVGVRWQMVDEPTPLGRWTHVAATREGSTLRLYVNGELKKTVEHYTTLSPWSAETPYALVLGGTDDRYAAEDGRSLCGSMREARVWNRARSGDEIRETMRQRLYGSEPGLVGYWPLSAPDAEDASVLSNVVRNGASGYLLAGWKLVEPLELADPPKGITIIVR